MNSKFSLNSYLSKFSLMKLLFYLYVLRFENLKIKLKKSIAEAVGCAWRGNSVYKTINHGDLYCREMLKSLPNCVRLCTVKVRRIHVVIKISSTRSKRCQRQYGDGLKRAYELGYDVSFLLTAAMPMNGSSINQTI